MTGPFFGINRSPLVDRNPVGGSCLAGNAGACAELILDPRAHGHRAWDISDHEFAVDNSPLLYSRQLGSALAFTFADEFIMADLEAQFGAEAFARFWKSQAPVPDAFETAFGVSLGDWTRDWMQALVGVHHAGPALQAGTAPLTLLAIMLCAALVSFVSTRRRVG